MLGHRERFERPDVPTPSAFRNMVSLGVIAVVAIVCLVLFRTFWHKANQMNYLNDKELYEALYDQADVTGPSDGRQWSDDSFSNCLVLIVDDIHAEQPELKGAQIIVRNTTQGTAAWTQLPLNTKLSANESTTFLSRLFSEAGAAAVLPPLTDAANVHVSHVIVASERIWDQLKTFEGPGIKALFTDQTNDFYTISSDMSTSDLVKFAESLQAIGFENIGEVGCPNWGDKLEDGSEVAVIDRQELPVAFGIFYWPS